MMKTTRDFRFARLARAGTRSNNPGGRAGERRRGENVGAIHSAARILEILSLRLRYSRVGHINDLRHWPDAEFSVKAKTAYRRGQRVLIEHVSPISVAAGRGETLGGGSRRARATRWRNAL